MFLLKKILAALTLPPAGPILLALFGLWLMRARSQVERYSRSRRWQGAGLWLATLSLLGLLLLSLPVVGNALMAPLEPNPPITAAQLQRAQAIVILGGGSYYAAPEYGGDTVSYYTLERLRYGAPAAAGCRWLSFGRPAPTAFSTASPSLAGALRPIGLGDSQEALNEYLGQLFNRLKETWS